MKKKIFLYFWWFYLLFSFSTCSRNYWSRIIQGVPESKGSLSGFVFSQEASQPLEKARLILENRDFRKETFSDKNGRYLLENIPTGFYTLTAKLDYYQPYVFSPLKIKMGKNKHNISLLKAGYQVIENDITQPTIWGEREEEKVFLIKKMIFLTSYLSIKSNTRVEFCPEAGLSVESKGRLEVWGEAEEKVIFTSFQEKRKGVWRGLIFKLGSSGELRYLHIEYSQQGINATAADLIFHQLTVQKCSREGIFLNRCEEISFPQSVVRDNRGSGIYLHFCDTVFITQSEIKNNGKSGIACIFSEGRISITQNNLIGNAKFGVRKDSSSSSELIVVDNCWIKDNGEKLEDPPTSNPAVDGDRSDQTQCTDGIVVSNCRREPFSFPWARAEEGEER